MNLNASLLMWMMKWLKRLYAIMSKDPLRTYLSYGDFALCNFESVVSDGFYSWFHFLSWVFLLCVYLLISPTSSKFSDDPSPKFELQPLLNSLKYVASSPKETYL